MLFGGKSRKRPFGAYNAFPGLPEPGFTPGIGDGHNQEQQDIFAQPEAQQPDPMQQQARPPSFWQGGDKFRWQDGVAGALAALGDGLSRQAGMEGGGVQMLAGGRMDALQRARKAQEAAQARAASVQRLLAAGYKQPQAEAMASGDLKASDVKADSPYRWEDNAGNVWERGPDGQNQRIFTDAIPKMYVQGDQAITIPNPYATQGGGQQRPEIGATLPDPRRTSVQQPPQASGLSPEAEQMRLAYLASNPVEGERMFREWQQRTGRR